MRVIVREKVIRRERAHCIFVLTISKGFSEFWGLIERSGGAEITKDWTGNKG